MTQTTPDILDPSAQQALLNELLDEAVRQGATDAKASWGHGRMKMVELRDGQLSRVESDENATVSLTVYRGKRTASIRSNKLAADDLRTLVERVMLMARIAPEDPYCGLAPAELVAQGNDDHLQLCDPAEPDAALLRNWAAEIDAACRTVPEVASCDSASAGWSLNAGARAATNGLRWHSRSTDFSVGAQAMARRGENMETGGCHRSARWRVQLPELSTIGVEAGTDAAQHLGARRVASGTVHAVFDYRVASSMLAPLLGAMVGSNVARGESFLKSRLGQRVCTPGFDLVEDPGLLRGHASAVVDADGVARHRRKLIDDGVLTTWLLDCKSAHQLKLSSTGHAGGTSNLSVKPGTHDRAALLREAGRGLLVTRIFSPSVNPHSGEWSAGVSGLWFDGGRIVHPVSEVTLAGSLPELYQNMTAGQDLHDHEAFNVPSLWLPDMTLGGL